jgi:Myb-like DNA-binding domain
MEKKSCGFQFFLENAQMDDLVSLRKNVDFQQSEERGAQVVRLSKQAKRWYPPVYKIGRLPTLLIAKEQNDMIDDDNDNENENEKEKEKSNTRESKRNNSKDKGKGKSVDAMDDDDDDDDDDDTEDEADSNGKKTSSQKKKTTIKKKKKKCSAPRGKAHARPNTAVTVAMSAQQEGTRWPLMEFKLVAWTKEEKLRYQNALCLQAQEQMLKNARAQGRESYERIMEVSSKLTPAQALTQIDPDSVDWHVVALRTGRRRSGLACRCYFVEKLWPSVARGAFTAHEDARLAALAAEHGGRRWQSIADAFHAGTGIRRTVPQLFARYQSKISKRAKSIPWSQTEDALLVQNVNAHGEHNWTEIAFHMHGRTAQQCLHRYAKVLQPGIKHGVWSLDEDIRLVAAITLLRPDLANISWTRVGQFVPTRTDVQCRERWTNKLVPNRNLGAFTAVEDARLCQMYGDIGPRWAIIAENLPGRSDNQCLRRFRVMQREREKPAQPPSSSSSEASEASEAKKVDIYPPAEQASDEQVSDEQASGSVAPTEKAPAPPQRASKRQRTAAKK